VKPPIPLRLPADHDPATCSECQAAHRDMQRFLERMKQTCRCCGTRIPDEHVVYIVGDLDDPHDDHWRMCGSCWRAGYQRGETIDSTPRIAGGAA